MWRRVAILLRARLAAGRRGGAPIAALLSQALVATFFCALVRDGLGSFPYGLFAFTLTGALVTIPLIGEFGWILRRDAAEEWVGALPILEHERKIARTLHLLIGLFGLALGSLLPAALLAPESTGLVARIAFPLLGLGLTAFLAAILLLVQNALGERAEGLLVAFQTVLVVSVVVGVVVGIRSIPTLARMPIIGDPGADFLWFSPPAWFAAPLTASPAAWRWLLPAGVGILALVLLGTLPVPARTRTVSTPWLSVLLWPARALATRFWLRPDERGPFDLIYDALPREREVVLRTVPMVGIPMAFLVVASTGDPEASSQRESILALLLFTAGIYLPILLTHVPASATPEAAWIHRTSPVSEGAMAAGAIKALAVRFLVPLYLLLAFVAWVIAGPEVVIRLALPGFLISLFVLRVLYRLCVAEAPLSIAPDAIRFDLDWFGPLGGIALLLTGAAIAANRLLSVPGALVLALVLLAGDLILDRKLRRRSG